jgi:hypothetical protein
MPYDIDKPGDLTRMQDKLKITYKNVSDTATRQAIHVWTSEMKNHGDEGKAWASVYSVLNQRGLGKKASPNPVAVADRYLGLDPRTAGTNDIQYGVKAYLEILADSAFDSVKNAKIQGSTVTVPGEIGSPPAWVEAEFDFNDATLRVSKPNLVDAAATYRLSAIYHQDPSKLGRSLKKILQAELQEQQDEDRRRGRR